MNNLLAVVIFLAIRWLSVFFVNTWFVPDEYWQSLEVAHKLVYGYGYLTWEWTHGIRSYIHPLIIALFYKFFNLIQLDSAQLLILLPRFLQATLSTYSDYCFWKWCGKTKWSMFCIGSSWFWFYTGSRTLINTLETNLTIIALSKFSFKENSSLKFLWIVGLVCALRPTGALVWIPLCLYNILSNGKSFKEVLTKYILIGLAVFGASVAIDSAAHGSLLISQWEFLKMNVLNNVGVWYGTHPWHWYLSQGIPAILGIQILPFIIAVVQILKNRRNYPEELILLGTVCFVTAIYSCLGHKEFRFLLPVLPIMLKISAQYLSNWSRKASDAIVWVVAIVILIGNVVPAVYWGRVHQKGTLEVMQPLRDLALKDPKDASILFLMPCHSTPLYSHLHVNVTARFLTCNPNLDNVDGYVDEADYFYKSPSTWMRNNYPPSKRLPKYIVAFDNLETSISDVLSRYKPISRVQHTYGVTPGDDRVGKYVVVHELLKSHVDNSRDV